MRVVPLEGGEKGERDGVRGVEGQGGGRVEVFDCGLRGGRVGQLGTNFSCFSGNDWTEMECPHSARALWP